MTRLTNDELVSLESNVDVYPHIGVLDHVRYLREAYAEIDALASRPIPGAEEVLAKYRLLRLTEANEITDVLHDMASLLYGGNATKREGE